MAYAELVSLSTGHAGRSALGVSGSPPAFVSPSSPRRGSSTVTEPLPYGSEVVLQLLQDQRLSTTSRDLIVGSWRPNTWKRYAAVFAKWQKFCVPRDIDPLHPAVADVINYLASLVDAGLGYSSFCTAKSAISSMLSVTAEQPLASHPLIQRFIKGVFNAKPPTPRYTSIWDVGLVIAYLRGLGAPSSLSFKDLTYKLVTLLTLLSASRVHYISSLSVDAMVLTDTQCTFFPNRLLKHSRPGFLGAPLKFTSYPAEAGLCVISVLRDYLQRRRSLSISHPQLLVSYRSPYKPVHRDTVSRWLREVLLLSGVNTEVFSSHSFRAASTSKARTANVPIDDILRQGQWATQLTWMQHYNLQVQPQPRSSVFAAALLDR